MDLNFLKSVRFWKLVLAAFVHVLGVYGVIDATLADAIAGVLGASVVVRTIDRASEHLGS